MLSILLIEDEKPAMERLKRLVHEFDPDIRIAGELGAVAESIQWLRTHPEPGLILADIQLTDGLSHEIFTSLHIQCPVIFVTAFDHYIIKAFEFNSIDYVLKPVKAERLHQALNKYLKMRSHFAGNLSGLQTSLNNPNKTIDRLMVKKGTEFKGLAISDIAWFYSELKVTFAIDQDGTRYIVEKSLTELEELLDKARFFRINRQYLCSIESIISASAVGKGRLSIKLNPKAPESIEVSQEKATSFKAWLGR